MKLKVEPPKDANNRAGTVEGKGLATPDPVKAYELSANPGDYLRIENNENIIFARTFVGHPEDANKGIIRIDEAQREELEVNISDKVNVEKVEVSHAQSITVAVPESYTDTEDFGSTMLFDIVPRVITKGQRVPVYVGEGKSINVKIVETMPTNQVLITENTDVHISKYSIECWDNLVSSRLQNAIRKGQDRLRNRLKKSVVALLVIVTLVLSLVVSAYVLSGVTDDSFTLWLQTLGPIVIVILSGLGLWYRLSD